VVRRVGQAVEPGFGESQGLQEVRLVLRGQLGQLGLDLGGEGNDLGDLAVGGERAAERLDVRVAGGDLALATLAA